jgi:hypothetical protein
VWYFVLQTKATRSTGINGRHRGEVFTTQATGKNQDAQVTELSSSDGGTGEILKKVKTYGEVRSLMEKYDRWLTKELKTRPRRQRQKLLLVHSMRL